MDGVYAARNPPLGECDSAYSFYDLIDRLYWDNASRDPLHRFCSLMRKFRAQSLVEETLVPGGELLEEKEDAEKRCCGPVHLTARRLTFFRSLPESERWDDPCELPDEHLLGYAVVVTLNLPNGKSCIYLHEAVCRPPSIFLDGEGRRIEPVSNYYVHSVREFDTVVGARGSERRFKILGSFFAQQSGLTSICGHASLRSALNSTTIQGGRKLTNRQINDILGLDFSCPERQVGRYDSDPPESKRGLTYDEMIEIVHTLGRRDHVGDFRRKAEVEYDRFIYPLVESSCPVILGIEGLYVREGEKVDMMRHVVPVLGHTMNSDRWEPEAIRGYGSHPVDPYIPAVRWCGHYIINDDNYGMYLTLPTDSVRNTLIPSKNPSVHAVTAIGVVPEEVSVSGYDAEQLSVYWALKSIDSVEQKPPEKWHDRLKDCSDSLVCRTLLQDSESYRGYIQTLTTEAGGAIPSEMRKTLSDLPKYLWVSEITIPNIYTGNKRKLGDVAVDATATEADQEAGESLVLAWFPGFSRPGLDKDVEPWPVLSHVPLLRSTEHVSALEW